jgi:hypothetical protein
LGCGSSAQVRHVEATEEAKPVGEAVKKTHCGIGKLDHQTFAEPKLMRKSSIQKTFLKAKRHPDLR